MVQLGINKKKDILLKIATCFDENAQFGFMSRLTSTHQQRFDLAIKTRAGEVKRLRLGTPLFADISTINIDNELKSSGSIILIRPNHFVSLDDVVHLFNVNEDVIVRKSFDSLKKHAHSVYNNNRYHIRVERTSEHTIIWNNPSSDLEKYCIEADSFEELLIKIDLQQTVPTANLI